MSCFLKHDPGTGKQGAASIYKKSQGSKWWIPIHLYKNNGDDGFVLEEISINVVDVTEGQTTNKSPDEEVNQLMTEIEVKRGSWK